MSLEDNIKIIKTRIEVACKKSNRKPEDIKIIAVTKYVDIEKIDEVLDFGFDHVGENKVQDALLKYQALHDRATWHFIGQLQSKKVKSVIDKFEYIHSLDRISLLKELDNRARQKNLKVNCFIQVNVSGEETKAGIAKDELLSFAKIVSEYNSIRVEGLMTIAPNIQDKEIVRSVFKELRELRDQINREKIFPYQLKELSMGMSNDFDIAIEEGATYIRVGTLLFK